MGSARLAGRVVALVTALLLAFPLHGLWRVVRRPSPWPARFLGWCARIIGAQPQVIGTPPTRDAVILSNHVSWIDILLLGSVGAVFVSKEEIRRVPVVGWLAYLHGTVFVTRADRLGVAEQVKQVRRALGPRPIAIFPEGTTDGGGVQLLPFKPALLAALDPPPPGIAVQPVRIDYGIATGDIAWTDKEPGLANALRILRRRGRFPVTLRFAEPFAPADHPGRKAIAAEARRRIEAM